VFVQRIPVDSESERRRVDARDGVHLDGTDERRTPGRWGPENEAPSAGASVATLRLNDDPDPVMVTCWRAND